MITQQFREIVQQEGYQWLIQNLPEIISIPVFHEPLYYPVQFRYTNM